MSIMEAGMGSGTARRGLAARCTGALWIALLALGACGDDGGDGGMAGGPAPPAALGEPCSPGCNTGLICARDGVFMGLCTVGCTTDQSCQVLAPGSRAACFGQTGGFCALSCATDACPDGMTCTSVASQMACVVAR
jgi:hypothetical protein